ncbi:hypothetical protein [Burkholderia sp. Bp9031]|nr:hypothetical protein [Burkholderia sp. Bp9031]
MLPTHVAGTDERADARAGYSRTKLSSGPNCPASASQSASSADT